MSPMTLRAAARLIAAAAAAALLAGCATLDKAPEIAVRERAAERWAALIGQDYDKSYLYMPPSYRAATPVDRYKNSFKGALKWTGAEVLWVKCETDDKCVARVKVDATVIARRGAPPLSNAFDETWIREDRGWWLFPTP